ncbi:hypothetical protein, partial [Pseudomonas amygdali]|uniref:hypothetical protein n=1 Tax=Pseudomonas amygdali TaxID=47877 RepID=UPI0019D3BFA1
MAQAEIKPATNKTSPRIWPVDLRSDLGTATQLGHFVNVYLHQGYRLASTQRKAELAHNLLKPQVPGNNKTSVPPH